MRSPIRSFFQPVFQALTHPALQWRRWRRWRFGGHGELKPKAESSPKAKSAARHGSTPKRNIDSGHLRGAAFLALLAAGMAVIGALVLVAHAQRLPSAAAQAGAANHALQALQSYLPGVSFHVPAQAGVGLSASEGGVLLIAAGMRAAAPLRVDLCGQRADPANARLAPLRIGYDFNDVKRWLEQVQVKYPGRGLGLKNLMLDSIDGVDHMPQLEITGAARADFADPAGQPLQLAWGRRQGAVWLVGDATQGKILTLPQNQRGQAALRQDAWLIWQAEAQTKDASPASALFDRALHIQRRASPACAQAGELLLQLYRAPGGGDSGKPGTPGTPGTLNSALITLFAAENGKVLSLHLPPGPYTVPRASLAALEDQGLFEQLLQHGLLRLAANGLIDVAPRDLPGWLASGQDGRVAESNNWARVRLDAAALKLLKRLYSVADGAYVRRQIQIFNSERRLLALRIKSAPLELTGPGPDGAPALALTAQVGAGKAATSAAMPMLASRLFAEMPQAWGPWARVAEWPKALGDAASDDFSANFGLALARPARGGERLELLLIGRLQELQGARLAAPLADRCSGRACPRPDAVRQIVLEINPGAQLVQIRAQALNLAELSGNSGEKAEQGFRHIRLAGGGLQWQAAQHVPTPQPARAEVVLRDRHGSLLWANGAPTAEAFAGGLATMLGLRAEQTNSVAAGLSRLGMPGGAGGLGLARVDATLTLDLPLQTLAQRVLECVGVRRGRWDGKACGDATQSVPARRRAGMVIVDTETGDILAAAGAGADADADYTGMAKMAADSAAWPELRDFDLGNPARSPLRLPAWQHDGGAHHSPGSTFKLISALGLEAAAQRQPQLEGLLAGMPLEQINRLAAQGGYAFRTHAACYPAPCAAGHAYVTNYHDQQVDRKASAGRFGLAQAMTYSLNTWFSWAGEISDRSLFAQPEGGAPDVQALDGRALDGLRPIVGMAHRLGFEDAQRLDGGLLPADFPWSRWDALQTTPAHIDPIHTRHELRQMAIGLRMQVTPLQMALVAGAIGQGRVPRPRLLKQLNQRQGSQPDDAAQLGVRLDRVRAGMKGVIDQGTAAGAFAAPGLRQLRAGLYGKTGTAPAGARMADGTSEDVNTVWFTGWLEPNSLPGQVQGHRWALAAFVSHSQETGGAHAAPIVAALLASLQGQPGLQSKKN